MKPTPPKNESKQDKFKRLASQRTNEVIKKLQILGNCANRGIYEYSKEDIAKIFNTIEKVTREERLKFSYRKTDSDNFKL